MGRRRRRTIRQRSRVDDDACTWRRRPDDDCDSHEEHDQSRTDPPEAVVLRVGLTGGIATGKSTVGLMFVELGCHLIDADRITHQLFEPGQPIHTAVVQAFGSEILAEDGTIDRKKLGAIVFSDPAARTKLNSLVHPAVIQRQQDWLKEIETLDPRGIAIVDAALMIEIGTYKNYDKVIVVTCSPEEQRRRLRL